MVNVRNGKRGILIGTKNTYDDWGLILTKQDIGYPAPKTTYINIPHGNGSLDLTEAMGGVKYSDRTGTLEFDLIAPPSERQSLLTNIANYVHGKKHTIVLPDDPHFVYHSRLAINNVQTSYMLNKLVINVVSDPYRVKPTATVKELYLVENLIPENARQFQSPPWEKYQGAEVDVTPVPMAVFEEGYARNYFRNSDFSDGSSRWSGMLSSQVMNGVYINTLADNPHIHQPFTSSSYNLGDVITVTYKARGVGRVRPYIGGGGGDIPTSQTPLLTNEWQVLTLDFEVIGEGNGNFALQMIAVGDERNIEIDWVTWHINGNNPNPTWTPAWEDLPLEDKPVSFIETSGGTSGHKYRYIVPDTLDTGKVNAGVKVKNISDKPMRVMLQQANSISNFITNTLQTNETRDVMEVFDTTNSTGSLQIQFRSETNSAGDDISFYAYQPAVYEVHGNTDVYMFDGEVEVNILNEGDNVVPKITTDAEITIKFKDLTFTVNAGTHILTTLVLENGDNIVTISGEDGTNIKFEYTERVI